MSDDVFASDQAGESVLDALVGEGKKFSDVEALAAGKQAADQHIQSIETENAELKQQLEDAQKAGNLGELVETLKSALAENKEGSDGAQTMSTEDLTEVIRSVVKGDESANTKAANRQKGNELVLGMTDGNVEAARALVAERAAKLGMSPQKLAELSEDSPSAFASLMNPDSSTASSGSPTALPGARNDVLDTNAPVLELDGFKTKAWFDERKKEMGHVKYLNDQSIQVELTRSMNGLGERFNN